MDFTQAKQMVTFWNIFAYGGDRPEGVSVQRWAAICKFFNNNM